MWVLLPWEAVPARSASESLPPGHPREATGRVCTSPERRLLSASWGPESWARASGHMSLVSARDSEVTHSSAPRRHCREERAPGGPGRGLPASACQGCVQASPQLPSWGWVAFVLRPCWLAGPEHPGVGVGVGRGPLQLRAWQLAGGRPLCSPRSLILLSHRVFFCSLSPRACVVFPSRFRAVEASCLFLRLPPALSTSQAPAHAPELARVQGRCQHRGPALPSAPSPRPLCPLASGWGGRRPGPCPLPPAPLRLRRRFQSNTGHRPDGPLPSQALGSRELDGVPPFSAQLSRPRGWGAALPPGTRAFTPDTAGGMGRAPWLPRGASIRDVA